MRNFFRSSFLFLFLLGACNFPGPGQSSLELTDVPSATPVRATGTPAQEPDYTECGFVWAREPLADVSGEFDAALKVVLPQATGRAEAYGENCMNNQGEVVRFLAMQTDFYVTLVVDDLNDKQALGDLIGQVLFVVEEFPAENTPGPQPGYLGIAFEADGEQVRLWFTQLEAQTALANGLQGEELFNALQAK